MFTMYCTVRLTQSCTVQSHKSNDDVSECYVLCLESPHLLLRTVLHSCTVQCSVAQCSVAHCQPVQNG